MRFPALTLAACAAASLTSTQPAHSEPADNFGSAEVRLAHISVQSMGSGTPVVLIPGLSTPRAVWNGLAQSLARNHRVLVVQVNGFGGDDPGANLKPGVLDGIVADLSAYIASNRLGRVQVIGHSMGGLTALKLALAHPDQVDSVAVVDTLPYFGVLMDPSATVEAVRPAAEAMRAKIESAYGKPVDPATVEANVKSLALKPESLALMKRWAAAADPRVTAEVFYEDLTTDLRPDLAAIKAPVTVIVPWSEAGFGEERTIAFYKRQYSALPGAAFVGVGDSGHFVMLDQPERFAEAVNAALRSANEVTAAAVCR